MQKRPWYKRFTISEMTGKVNTENSWLTAVYSTFWKMVGSNKTTIDYTKNDYDLFRSIYYASVMNNKGKEYQMAAPLGKPVINILAGYVAGRGVTVSIDDNDDIETDINEWLNQNKGILYDFVKFSYRDGDSFVYIDELGNIRIEEASSVDVMTDPVTGLVIGFDVHETTKEVDPVSGREEGYVYLRQYRTDSVQILKWKENETREKAEVVFSQVYYNEPGNEQSGLSSRRLPIIHYPNEPEARAIYGNSEFQNLLIILRNYSAVLENSTKSVIYNGTPIPVLKGVQNQDALEAASKDENDTSTSAGKKLEWGSNSVLYVNGENGDAKFLQANGIMDDTAKLLEIYFYLIVQGGETPEFAFGTAVSSSKASTETQSPVLVRKVERKQTQLAKVIELLVETYIEKKQLISDPLYLKLKNQEYALKVNFPPIDQDDKQLTLETVQWAVEQGILSEKTALELLLADKIKDVTQELKDAAEEAKKAAEQANAVPEQQNRLFQELLSSQTGATQPSTQLPDETGGQ